MDTGQMIADRIEAFIEERGTNPRAVALAAGMSPTGVRDIITRKTKNPTYANLAKIAEVLGVEVSDFVSGSKAEMHHATTIDTAIAVAGKVGAGAKVDLIDAYSKGDGLYHVACPPQISPHGIVAVEVEGTSMAPTYEPGAVLFYSRDTMGVPTEAIGRICVCEDEASQAWVKQVKVGTEEGTFSLISLNPAAENMHGVRLKWAAPVRFSLPPEFVNRVE